MLINNMDRHSNNNYVLMQTINTMKPQWKLAVSKTSHTKWSCLCCSGKMYFVFCLFISIIILIYYFISFGFHSFAFSQEQEVKTSDTKHP